VSLFGDIATTSAFFESRQFHYRLDQNKAISIVQLISRHLTHAKNPLKQSEPSPCPSLKRKQIAKKMFILAIVERQTKIVVDKSKGSKYL